MKKICFFVWLLCLAVVTNSFAQSVGTTEATFDVSDLGGATYTIPIKIPDGIGGVQPSLAFSYNSQGGNSVMGMGWSLTGISAITRTSNSIYLDKNVKGVSLTYADKLALDGNRLMLTSGSYGADNSYYRTELEQFKTIIANGTSGNGPLSFSVTDINGVTYEYGNNANSRCLLSGQTTPYMWLLNKVTDLNGNYMTFEYWNTAGEEPLLRFVDYTGNNITGAVPKTRITYHYHLRSDPNFKYVAGGKINQVNRLGTVQVQSRNAAGTLITLRSYLLNYSTDLYSHLIKVTEKGDEISGVAAELPPTEFTYGSAMPAVTVSNMGLIVDNNVAYNYAVGDYNGDGVSDMIRFPTYINNGTTWELHLRRPAGLEAVQSGQLYTHPGYENQTIDAYNFIRNQTQSIPFDFNGDGKDDFGYLAQFVNQYSSNQRYTLYLSTGSALSQISPDICTDTYPVGYTGSINDKFHYTTPFVGDFDGDGKSEILALNNKMLVPNVLPNNWLIGEQYLKLSESVWSGNYVNLAHRIDDLQFDASYIASNQSKIFVIDYNGDGKNEILSIWQNHAQVMELNVTFDANNKPVLGSPTFKMVKDTDYPTIDHEVFTGDFNGDGITDVLTWKSGSGWQVGYGKGDGAMNEVMTGPGLVNADPVPSVGTPKAIYVADFNGDGKMDIYENGSGSNAKVFYSKGNNLFNLESISFSPSYSLVSPSQFHLGDMNGDGAADFLLSRATQYLAFHENESKHEITNIKNGFGAQTSIYYSRLTNTAITTTPFYEAASTAYTYPFVTKGIPMTAVRAVVDDNGTTSGSTTYFRYKGLRYNLRGKGLLGFEQKTSLLPYDNTAVIKTFGLNTTFAYPYLQSVLTRQGTNIFNFKTLYSETSTADVYHYGSNRIFPYITQKVNTDNVNYTTKTTTYNYVFPSGMIPYGVTYSSAIGKPMSITINEGSGLFTSTETYSYPNYSSGFGGVNYPIYYYSKPKSVLVTNTRQGQPSYSRRTDYTYSTVNGLLTTLTNDPGTSKALTTTYTYNSYGNVLDKSVSTAGITNRLENYGYDPSNRYTALVGSPTHPDLKTITTFNSTTGKAESIMLFDGSLTNTTYDGFGRNKTISDNTGTSEQISYEWASGNGYAPAGAVYTVKTTPNTAAANYKFYDRLGRLLRTAYSGATGGMIYEDVKYNVKGQIESSTKPYFASSGVPQTITNSYDAFGRLLQEVRPESTTTYTYTTSGGTYKVASSSSGLVKEVTTDRSGRKTKVKDEGGTLLYTYHSNGQVANVELEGSGSVNTILYDEYARVSKMTDPNYGTYEYDYNGFGEVIKQQDPKGTIYEFAYDDLGNQIQKTGPEGTYNYNYTLVAGTNCGKLTQITAPGNVTQNMDYGLGDNINYEERILGTDVFKTSYTYDNFGRLKTKTFPNNTTIEYGYFINNGTLNFIKNTADASNKYLMFDYSRNAYGQIQNRFMGMTMVNPNPSAWQKAALQTSTYDVHGYLTQQKSVRQDATVQQFYQYNFDIARGNLLQRKDIKNFLQEDFTFDNVSRLTQAQGQITGTFPAMLATLNLSYTANGNIETKSDAGTFAYDQANRVSEINPYVNIPAETQSITYTPFNKVLTIEEGTRTAAFTYWADGSRSSMSISDNGIAQRTKFYGADFEREVNNVTGSVRDLCYVTGPDGKIIAILENKDGVNKSYFVLTDHIGNWTQIVDESGSIVEEKSFDAWGRARNPNNWYPMAPVTVSNGWDRGFTGHEFIPEFGLINMDGRLYDPLLGRMVSPDPNINGAENSQAYNRYTYAANNPLTYTDPDGNFWHIVIGAAIGGVVNLGMQAIKGNVKDFSSGLKAFGVGAVVGGVAAATGGAVLGVATGAGATAGITGTIAAGAGGFGAGFASGMASGMVSGPLLTAGNAIFLGDRDPNKSLSEQMWESAVLGGMTGGILGGLTNGISALANGRTFFDGNFPKIQISPLQGLTSPKPLPIELDESALAKPLANKPQLTPNQIGKTGEVFLENQGMVKRTFDLSAFGEKSKRVVDGYMEINNFSIISESKVGYKAATEFITKQAMKDYILLSNNVVQSVEWHFFVSPVTGLGGPSAPLMQLLKGYGFKIFIH